VHTVAVSEFGSRFVKGLCYLLAPEDSGRVAIHLAQQAGQRFGTCEAHPHWVDASTMSLAAPRSHFAAPRLVSHSD